MNMARDSSLTVFTHRNNISHCGSWETRIYISIFLRFRFLFSDWFIHGMIYSWVSLTTEQGELGVRGSETTINNTSATEILVESKEWASERANIGISVTCCDIIYLFDRCFPFFAVRLRVGKVVPGEEGKLKVLPLFHVIPLLTFNSFIIQTALLTEWLL